MRRRGYPAAAGVLTGVVLVVGACSHSPARNVRAGEVLAPEPAASRPAHVAGGYGDVAAGSSVGGIHGLPPGAQGVALRTSVRLPIGGGYQIRTAQLTVAIKHASDVANQANEAISIAVSVGGEVDSDDRTSGKHATAALRLRVPPEELEATLTALSKLGAEQSRQTSTTDVTGRVADVNSRVLSAEQSIARLRTLYASATKVGDVIRIEGELSSREADLESLQAQQRALSRETSLATIDLSLVTAAKHPVTATKRHKSHRNGFVAALERGWHGFTKAASWIVDVLGTVLPFAILLLVLAVLLRVVRPRLPRRSPTPTPTE